MPDATKNKIAAEIIGQHLVLRIPMKIVTVLAAPGEIEAPVYFAGREQQYFELLLQGKQHKEIAALMGVGVRSSKHTAGKIYRKLGVRDRVQLMRKFTQMAKGD